MRRRSIFDFQDGRHLGFPIRTILPTVDLQVTSLLPINYESTALLVQEKKFKIDCQHGYHLGFPNRMNLAIFDLQATRILPIKFQINGPFFSGKEVQNRFSGWQL